MPNSASHHTDKENNIPLPLSWRLTDEPAFTEVNLTRNTVWLPFGDVPAGYDYVNHIKQNYTDKGKKVLIRGCNDDIRTRLETEGFGSLLVGEEAILRFDTEHFRKESLQELVKRGGKHGTVREVIYSPENAEKLKELVTHTRHGRQPQLCYLFHTKFLPDMRLFVLESGDNKWLGGLLIARNGISKLHTELLLRRNGAPVGVMEALIHGTYQKLKLEDWHEWSLGEVPFVSDLSGYNLLSKTSIVNRFGRALRFAYNYYGLQRFKDKYGSHWQPVYLCAYPRVTHPMLYRMYTTANLGALIWDNIFNRDIECVRVNTAIK